MQVEWEMVQRRADRIANEVIVELTTLPEWRCTRRTPYAPGCIGHSDISARQGYYIRAVNAVDALNIIKAQFPGDTMGFDVQYWKPPLGQE